MAAIRLAAVAGIAPSRVSWARPKRLVPAVAILTLALLFYFFFGESFTSRKQQLSNRLRNGGAERLRNEAAILYKDLYARHGQREFVEIWFSDWPPTFRKFSPRHVGAYVDGFILATDRNLNGEMGLFIVPESMDHVPSPAKGTTYEQLTPGIYWYSFSR